MASYTWGFSSCFVASLAIESVVKVSGKLLPWFGLSLRLTSPGLCAGLSLDQTSLSAACLDSPEEVPSSRFAASWQRCSLREAASETAASVTSSAS